MRYEKPGRSGWTFESGHRSATSGEVYRPSIVGGRYRVTGVLSQRPSSDVITAVDVREDRQVVVKRIRFPDRATGSRLRQAHQVLSGLRAPEVAPVRDLLEGKADSWIVWDRVSGVALQDYRDSLPVFNGASFQERWAHVGPVFDALLHGLETMHRSSLPHLDVKPSNVLVGPDGSPVLVDIGVADAGEGEDKSPQAYSGQDVDMGFLAPEQADGEPGGLLSDQWSLAALLYFLITGEKAVGGNDPEQLAQSYGQGEVKPLREHVTDTPEELEQIVLRMLQWQPEQRYEDLGLVRDALKNYTPKRSASSFQLWSVAAPPLVGRDPFLAFFSKRLRELEAGSGCVLQVVSDEGYGKSRLVAAWEEAARSNPSLTVYSASCLPGHPRAVLHGWFQPPPCDPEAPPPDDLVEQALGKLSGPTVVLLDTLEEVDGISWARVHRAAAVALDEASGPPVIVVLSGRRLPDLAPRIDLANPRLFNISLPPLSPADVADLLRPESNDDDDVAVRDSAAAMLCEETGGVPGVLISTFLGEQREGRLERDGRRWIARVGQSIDEQIMPPRPRQLDDLLQLLITLGGSVEIGVALRCLPTPKSEVLECLDWACRNDLVDFRVAGDRWFMTIADPGGSLGEQQEAHLPALNEQVALWLESHGEYDGLIAERTAVHWREAGAQRSAGEAYLRASRANESIGSNTDARRLAALGRTLLQRG